MTNYTHILDLADEGPLGEIVLHHGPVGIHGQARRVDEAGRNRCAEQAVGRRRRDRGKAEGHLSSPA